MAPELAEREAFDRLAGLLERILAETKRLLYQHFKVAPQTRRYKKFALIVLNDMVRKSESVDAMIKAEKLSGIGWVARQDLRDERRPHARW